MTEKPPENTKVKEAFITLLNFVFVVFVCVFFIGAVITGHDTTKWWKTDNDGNCYIRTVEESKVWLTPGEDKIDNTLFCKPDFVKEEFQTTS